MSQANASTSHSPPGTGTFGLVLFLISLSMLFIAAMVAYSVIRLRHPTVEIDLPLGLWASTFVLLISSVTMHWALLSVRAERQRAFQRSLFVTTALGYVFIAIQAPMLVKLLAAHEVAAASNVYLYSLIISLIVLHALHVIGGIIPMTIACVQARRGRYDHEHHEPIKHRAMYWHFLDIVWLIMFNLMLLLG